MDNDLDKFVKNEMKIAIHENKNKLSRSLIRKIPDTNISYNSVGKQNSGKGYMLIQEIIKISISCPNTHLLIYSNKSGKETDDTFESLKHLIRIPIVYVKHDDLPEFLQTLQGCKLSLEPLLTKNEKWFFSSEIHHFSSKFGPFDAKSFNLYKTCDIFEVICFLKEIDRKFAKKSFFKVIIKWQHFSLTNVKELMYFI